MEELKLVLKTIESLGDTGYNIFLVWLGKEIITHVFIGIIIYIMGMAIIRMIKTGLDGWNWNNECKRALRAKHGYKPWITNFDNDLSDESKGRIIEMITKQDDNV